MKRGERELPTLNVTRGPLSRTDEGVILSVTQDSQPYQIEVITGPNQGKIWWYYPNEICPVGSELKEAESRDRDATLIRVRGGSVCDGTYEAFGTRNNAPCFRRDRQREGESEEERTNRGGLYFDGSLWKFCLSGNPMSCNSWIHSSPLSPGSSLSLPSSFISIPSSWKVKEKKIDMILTISLEVPPSISPITPCPSHSPSTSLFSSPLLENEKESAFEVGEEVVVKCVTKEVAMTRQQTIGWHPLMAACLGKRGRIINFVMRERKIEEGGGREVFGVRVNVENFKFLWNSSLLRKTISSPIISSPLSHSPPWLVGQIVRMKRTTKEFKIEKERGVDVGAAECRIEEIDESDCPYRIVILSKGQPTLSLWCQNLDDFELVERKEEGEGEKKKEIGEGEKEREKEEE